MIKVGILGAQTTAAGELIRILINHPEVEIRSLYSPSFAGRPVSSRHHGLLGEKIVNFSDKLNPEELDILFITDEIPEGENIIKSIDKWEDLRLIDLTHSDLSQRLANGFEYGLSEINRKTLVRGTKKSVIPSSEASLSLIGIAPLAFYLMLPQEINISIAAPKEVVEKFENEKITKEIFRQLNKIQKSFNGKINFEITPNKSRRVMRVKANFKCPLAIEEIEKIYESYYDDHNFVFTSLSEVEGKEVEGTHKTIVTFTKPEPDMIEIEIVGDCRLRGGAGDAVHVLNLFFALYEKIGLQLKPSRYGESQESTSRPPSWFG